MSGAELAISIAILAGGTMLTRYLPFVLFSGSRTPEVVRYLGRYLPPASVAMLVVYCFKDISLASPPHGAPEATATAATVALHLAFRRPLVSIAAGTAIYMILLQHIF